MFCYLNGYILRQSQAHVPLNDIALLRAYSVFDYLRTHNGKPFLLNEHLSRFQKSANGLNLQLPEPISEIKTAINLLLKKNNLKEAGIRLVLTGGITNDSISYSKPNFFILIETLNKIQYKIYLKGAKLITHQHQRELPQIKTINYLTSVSLGSKLKKGIIDVLYFSHNKALECSRSNIFIFKKEQLITPKDNILIGTRRNLILKLAKQNFKVSEKEINLRQLYNADEVFITSTGKGVVPIISIDERLINKGTPGKGTQHIMERYKEITRFFDG